LTQNYDKYLTAFAVVVFVFSIGWLFYDTMNEKRGPEITLEIGSRIDFDNRNPGYFIYMGDFRMDINGVETRIYIGDRIAHFEIVGLTTQKVVVTLMEEVV